LFEEKELNAQMSGSTLITILLENKGLLTCANVGDSRAILARQSIVKTIQSIKRIGKSSICHKTISLLWKRKKKEFYVRVAKYTALETNKATRSDLRECGYQIEVNY
jgi:hypothetical protein